MRMVIAITSLLVLSCTSIIPEGVTQSESITPEPSPLVNLTQAAGPLSVNPDNPRYLTDGSGKAVYLTGSHTWANFMDAGESDPPPVFDYPAYLSFLVENHHNFFRLWTWEQAKWANHTSGGIWFVPIPYQRTGPGAALDGKPKFDLTKFNQAYFNRMRSRIIEAGDRGIYVSIMLFNGFSVGQKPGSTGNPWPGHPYNAANNVNGIDGDPNNDDNGYEVQTLAIPTVTAIQEAYIRKVIDTVNDLDNVLYEICNECNAGQQERAWQYHMIDFIHNYEAGKLKQHPVGMTVSYPNGNNTDLFNSPAEWISPNPDGGYQDDPPASDGTKVIVTDTDHLWGVGGDRTWVWKSFTRGMHPIYMDCYSELYCPGSDPGDPTRVSVVKNMGSTWNYATRMNLVAMTPREDLCSTGYCLANPVAQGAEYLVYLPNGGTVSVDLSAASGNLTVEWFNPDKGTTISGGTTSGGASREFTPSFGGDAVLYLYQSSLPPNLIFADYFERGNLSKWTSCKIDGGDLSARSEAKHLGNYGMRAVVDDNVSIYCTDDTPNIEKSYHVRFYFNPSNLIMAGGNQHRIFSGYSGLITRMLSIEFRYFNGQKQVRVAHFNDRNIWKYTAWHTISDAWHSLEVYWKASTAAGANNGILRFWIDGLRKTNWSAIDNDTRRIDRVRLGAVEGIDTGTRGGYSFDDFISRRYTYIGP